MSDERIVSATEVIKADAATIFEYIADPAKQPLWDGNENLGSAEPGQRVHAVGDVFTMTITKPSNRENHVSEFEEGRRIAWMPAPVGEQPPGHEWAWRLEPAEGGTRVTHVYDWTRLQDGPRLDKASKMTSDNLRASIVRLRDLVEGSEQETS